ncbi:hypothetical protein FC08_GL000814 [Latilactobacillus curvatus JCM 1096 = DSM 20019]|uniref:Uncharacterized protein n=2 Tax=Latilactobacillus curvatus TaxID=28038 RepID=A0AAJ0PCG1_LATCU|nr:hypothetical protein FC08_GL000814 [Latilactobacillus curvatus JCM 1096 = DSM 20019]
MAGFGSVDSSPELEQAKIEKAKADVRKTKAEADIKEAEAKAVGDTDSSGITLEIIRTDRRGQSDETKS